MGNQLTPPELNFLDKHRVKDDAQSGSVEPLGPTVFVATGAGSTTTIVGGAPDLTDGTNVLRSGESFALQTSASAFKEDTVFQAVSFAQTSGSATLTFSPAAKASTAAGDKAVLVASRPYDSIGNLDTFLTANGYDVNKMTLNDKVFAARTLTQPDSFK